MVTNNNHEYDSRKESKLNIREYSNCKYTDLPYL